MEPREAFVGRALLFDQLTDDDPESSQEVRPLRAYNKKDLLESVRTELSRLLNTRSPIPGSAFDELDGLKALDRTVINYGVPDITSYSPQNSDDRRRLAKSMEHAIEAFEPRLRNVSVTIDPPAPNERTLTARVEAILSVESVREPVSFPIIMKRDNTNE